MDKQTFASQHTQLTDSISNYQVMWTVVERENILKKQMHTHSLLAIKIKRVKTSH